MGKVYFETDSIAVVVDCLCVMFDSRPEGGLLAWNIQYGGDALEGADRT